MESQTALRGIIAVFHGSAAVRPRFKRIIPAIAKSLPHLAGIIFRPDDAIFADSDGEAVVANAGIIQEVEILTFFQFENDLFFCRAGHHAMLRSHRAAQIGKGQYSIESRHYAHHEPIFPSQRQPWVVRTKQHFFVRFRDLEGSFVAGSDLFLRLGLLFQRGAPIRRQAHPRAEAKQKQIQNAKDHIERQRIVVQMSQRGTVQNRIIQHNRRIQKGRDTEADHQPQQPPIPGTDITQQEKAQCREQIPFVNFHGQHVNSRQQQRQKAGKMLCIGMMQTAQDNGSVDQCHHCIAVQAPRAAHRRHHKQIYGKHRAKQADLSILGAQQANQKRLFLADAADRQRQKGQQSAAARCNGKRPPGEQRQLRPVGRQQIIPVGSIQRRIGVGRKRIGVQLDNPSNGVFLFHGEGKDNRCSDHDRSAEADRQPAQVTFFLLGEKHP